MARQMLSIFVVLFSALPGFVYAQEGPADAERRLQVDGYEVFLGVVPSEVALAQHGQLHQDRPEGRNSFHVLVSIFTREGRRVKEAEVKARVSPLGIVGLEQSLEATRIPSTDFVSFGGFFEMKDPGLYRIEVRFRPQGEKDFRTARFVHRRARD